MRTYIRHHTSGASYFFTVNAAWRNGNDVFVKHIDPLRQAIKNTQHQHPFKIDAIVILPDHIHAIWTMPDNDGNYSKRWRLIKSIFSRSLPKGEHISPSRMNKGERGIWQRRYWEHQIKDDTDFERHVNYIHYNPVKHGLVKNAADWPYSSFHRFMANGKLPNNWSGNNIEGQFGE
jgi:putative transposase